MVALAVNPSTWEARSTGISGFEASQSWSIAEQHRETLYACVRETERQRETNRETFQMIVPLFTTVKKGKDTKLHMKLSQDIAYPK